MRKNGSHFHHGETCSCCHDNKELNFALIELRTMKNEKKFNIISAQEALAFTSEEEILSKKNDLKEIIELIDNEKFENYYAGIYYIPELYNISSFEEFKNHYHIYFDNLEFGFVGLNDILLFPEKKKKQGVIEIIPCIVQVAITKSAKEIKKNWNLDLHLLVKTSEEIDIKQSIGTKMYSLSLMDKINDDISDITKIKIEEDKIEKILNFL
ncbi:MAG: hypothetical protein KGV57_02185 [Fusobacterium sp.]|nr:hypothetical protein [Fusobacterium sp.]